jgi:hypothetical protein
LQRCVGLSIARSRHALGRQRLDALVEMLKLGMVNKALGLKGFFL